MDSDINLIRGDYITTISELLSEINSDNLLEKCTEIVEISESMKNSLTNMKQDSSNIPYETPIKIEEKSSLPNDDNFLSQSLYNHTNSVSDLSEVGDYSNSS